MNALTRLRNWWLGRFRGAGLMGKGVLLLAPLLLGCCTLTMISALLLPPDTEPTAEIADRSAATLEVEEATATPTTPKASATAQTSATKTSLPTATDEPPTPRPSATRRPATATAAPSATKVAPTATNAPPTATDAPIRATTAVLPTATLPPTVAPTLAPPTAVPPTVAPPTTEPPTALPTATLPTISGALVIIAVDKRAEVVTIRNESGAAVDLAGWRLYSEKGNQDCPLGGTIEAGATLQIWAMAEDEGQGGFNCRFESDIWNNSEPDVATLIDPSGAVVSRW